MQYPIMAIAFLLVPPSLGQSGTSSSGSTSDPTKMSSVVSPDYTMSWAFTDTTFILQLDLAATVEWAGWGIGEPGAGGMEGADIALCSLNEGVWSVQDSYSLSQALPEADVSQDWTLTRAEQVDGKTRLELERPLNTGDSQDRVISANNPLAIDLLYAWGSGALGYHGVTNRVRGKLGLSSAEDPIQTLLSAPDYDKFVEMRNPSFAIPTDETTYQDEYFDLSNFPEMAGRTIIGMAGVVEDGPVKPLIHHFVVSGITQTGGVEVLYAWAPGSQPLIFPAEVGFSADTYSAIKIQTHYNNPQGLTGLVDTNGMRFYLTAVGVTRTHEFGVFQVGDPDIQQFGQAVVGGISRWTYTCPSLQASQPITIFQHQLHMHETGVQMRTRHYRASGEEVGGTQIEFYSFDYQDAVFRGEPALPGDRFETECTYKTSSSGFFGSAAVKFGLGSSDEMCIDFLGYYPRNALTMANQKCGLGYGGSVARESLDSVPIKFGVAAVDENINVTSTMQPMTQPPTQHPSDANGPVGAAATAVVPTLVAVAAAGLAMLL